MGVACSRDTSPEVRVFSSVAIAFDSGVRAQAAQHVVLGLCEMVSLDREEGNEEKNGVGVAALLNE